MKSFSTRGGTLTLEQQARVAVLGYACKEGLYVPSTSAAGVTVCERIFPEASVRKHLEIRRHAYCTYTPAMT